MEIRAEHVGLLHPQTPTLHPAFSFSALIAAARGPKVPRAGGTRAESESGQCSCLQGVLGLVSAAPYSLKALHALHVRVTVTISQPNYLCSSASPCGTSSNLKAEKAAWHEVEKGKLVVYIEGEDSGESLIRLQSEDKINIYT